VLDEVGYQGTQQAMAQGKLDVINAQECFKHWGSPMVVSVDLSPIIVAARTFLSSLRLHCDIMCRHHVLEHLLRSQALRTLGMMELLSQGQLFCAIAMDLK
jgi:hypothetical protein